MRIFMNIIGFSLQNERISLISFGFGLMSNNFITILQIENLMMKYSSKTLSQFIISKHENLLMMDTHKQLHYRYISMQAPARLGFDDAIRTKIECSICQPDRTIGPLVDTFDQAVWMIYTILQQVCYSLSEAQHKTRLCLGIFSSVSTQCKLSSIY